MRVQMTDVYTGLDQLVLLAGGDKSTQQRDIKSAIALAKNL